MSGFSADWLALREPLRYARAQSGRSRCRRCFAQSLSFGQNCQILPAAPDRRCARLRPVFLPSRIGDLSTTILACWRARPRWRVLRQCPSRRLPLDLNRDLEAALDGPVDLITASALLDLVSEAWLERLAVEIAARSIPIYAALSYDGRIEINPADSFDDAIIAAVNAHQRTR